VPKVEKENTEDSRQKTAENNQELGDRQPITDDRLWTTCYKQHATSNLPPATDID